MQLNLQKLLDKFVNLNNVLILKVIQPQTKPQADS